MSRKILEPFCDKAVEILIVFFEDTLNDDYKDSVKPRRRVFFNVSLYVIGAYTPEGQPQDCKGWVFEKARQTMQIVFKSFWILT